MLLQLLLLLCTSSRSLSLSRSLNFFFFYDSISCNRSLNRFWVLSNTAPNVEGKIGKLINRPFSTTAAAAAKTQTLLAFLSPLEEANCSLRLLPPSGRRWLVFFISISGSGASFALLNPLTCSYPTVEGALLKNPMDLLQLVLL